MKIIRLTASALVLSIVSATAQAACTAPSGTYVGVGTGAHYTCSTTPSNGSCATNLVDDVIAVNASITFSSTSAQSMKWRISKLGLASTDITFTLPKMVTTTSTSPSTSASTYHYFNSTLCRGFVKATGTLDNTSVSLSGSIGAQFTYVSTGSGSIVTLVYDGNDAWSSSTYTMRMEKP